MRAKPIIALTAAAALAVGGVVASFSPETDQSRTLGNAETRWGTVYTTEINDGDGNSISVADLAGLIAKGGGGTETDPVYNADKFGLATKAEVLATIDEAAMHYATAAQGALAETAYQKPAGGIPAEDLAKDYALDADLTSHAANTVIHVTQTERNKWDAGGSGSGGSGGGIATETDPVYAADKPMLALKSEMPDVSNFLTANDLPAPPDLTSYAKTTDVTKAIEDAVDALPAIPDLSGYPTTAAMDAAIEEAAPDLSLYPTKTEMDTAIAAAGNGGTGTGGDSGAYLGEIRLLPFRPEELPPGWRVCDGSYFSRGTPEFTAIGLLPANLVADWGIAGNSLRAALPDLRGNSFRAGASGEAVGAAVAGGGAGGTARTMTPAMYLGVQ